MEVCKLPLRGGADSGGDSASHGRVFEFRRNGVGDLLFEASDIVLGVAGSAACTAKHMSGRISCHVDELRAQPRAGRTELLGRLPPSGQALR